MTNKPITEFTGDHRYLSNFYHAPFPYRRVKYLNAEAAFHAQKDPRRALEFTNLPPNQAKRLGRRVHLRDDWDDVREQIMYDIVATKFKHHDRLAKRLIETGDRPIIEGNYWHDNFYGDCYCNRCVQIDGQNKLGLILEDVRQKLKENTL